MAADRTRVNRDRYRTRGGRSGTGGAVPVPGRVWQEGGGVRQRHRQSHRVAHNSSRCVAPLTAAGAPANLVVAPASGAAEAVVTHTRYGASSSGADAS